MAVKCSSCGASNRLEDPQCGLCGADLFAKPDPAREATMANIPAPAAENTSSIPEAVVASVRGIVVGGKVANRYLVRDMIGRGGVAMVFRATDESLGEEIALKVFPNLQHQDPADLERFKREVLVNRKIHHLNVIRVHDFGIVGNDAYLTMELLAGGTLAERIEEKALPVLDAVEIAIGVAEGLHAAHIAGIVHRDVKPENVLFDASGRPKLVDFGLARLLDATTQTRGFSGTPFYMSPEQAEGGEITEQTDIYSLGILLFELFTGQLPFFADSLVAIAMKHASEAPPRPSSIRPGIPPVVEEMILACMQKAPANRPESAGQIATVLRKWRREGGIDDARALDANVPASSRPRPRVRTPSDSVRLPQGQRETVIARVPHREADRETAAPPEGERTGRKPSEEDTFETGKRPADPTLSTPSGARLRDPSLQRPSSGAKPAVPRPPEPDTDPAPRESGAALSSPSGKFRVQAPPPRESSAPRARADLASPSGSFKAQPPPPPPEEALKRMSREEAMELPPGRPRSRRLLFLAIALAAAGGALTLLAGSEIRDRFLAPANVIRDAKPAP